MLYVSHIGNASFHGDYSLSWILVGDGETEKEEKEDGQGH